MSPAASASPAPRKLLLSRARIVLAMIACGAALCGLSQAEWINAEASDLAGALIQLEVKGTAAVPAAMACALTYLCASVLCALAKRRLGVLSLMVALVASLGSVICVLAGIADPRGAATTAVADTTAIVGSTDFTVTLNWWVWLSLAVSVLAAVVPGVGLWALRALPGPHQVRVQDSRAATARSQAIKGAEKPLNAHDDAPEIWDALSKGEDPTR